MTYTLKIVYPHHHFHPPNKKSINFPQIPLTSLKEQN